MYNDFIKYQSEIDKIFEQHKIETAFIFGSVLNEKFNENSDIDFLVKFKKGIEPLEKGELWWDLHDTLRKLFKCEIDIVTENS
ncbi:MAG: nucleotidyltransferase domain-containing protein, partial [Bacteroidota bacterium]|nr:nucleotidyltransferase domain-containing protein [Bacteroidota bacterium]